MILNIKRALDDVLSDDPVCIYIKVIILSVGNQSPFNGKSIMSQFIINNEFHILQTNSYYASTFSGQSGPKVALNSLK